MTFHTPPTFRDVSAGSFLRRLTALSDTAIRAVRHHNSALGDAARDVRDIVLWNARAYAHQHIACSSQLTSRRDRCRSLLPPSSRVVRLGAFDATKAQKVQATTKLFSRNRCSIIGIWLFEPKAFSPRPKRCERLLV